MKKKKDDQIKELQKRIKKLEAKTKPKNILEKLGESKDLQALAEIAALFGVIKLIHSVGDD